MADVILQFEDVVLHSEEGKIVFQGLDWSLDRGLKVNLRAVPASQASALFGLAAGITHPHRGQVMLDGTPFAPYAHDHPFLRRGALGWVPREGGLLVNLSLVDNIVLPLIFAQRTKRSEAEAKAAEALQATGLQEVADHRPHALDPSERWLGALARAWAMAPELWLVDEPSGSLHRRHQEAAATILDQVASSPATVVIAGDEGWIPWISMQVMKLEHGKLKHGDHDAVRT